MPHPALSPNNVAVITGGASGIGLAAAMRFARLGMKVCIADLDPSRLAEAETRISSVAPGGAADIMMATVDVSRIDDVSEFETAVRERFGGADILMNNAGIQPGSEIFGSLQDWRRVIGVNLWGVIHGSHIFAPGMIERGRPGLIINTGSKQGITTPPGDPAYNVSKAGVKAFTEALQHELRNAAGSQISAHLLIPGFVFTGLTAKGRTEKPAGAWTPEQPSTLWWNEWRPGISTSCARITTCREASTSAGFCGRRATSSKTAPRCRVGIRITLRLLRPL